MFESLQKDYQLFEEIGRGRFGVVYRCFSLVSGHPFACKSVDKRLLSDDPTDRDSLVKEPKILRTLAGNRHTLQLYDVYEDDRYLHMIVDLCDSPDLFDRISKRKSPLSEVESASIFTQLIASISYCHKLGIAHRDIKPDNILFDSRNALKLADFGSAECFRAATMTGVVGTPYYVAPEVLLGREYSEKVDVWSAGVVLYVMLAGFPPFHGESPEETFEAVLRGNLRFPTRIFRSVSSEAKDLLRKMICRNVSKRLSAEDALRHPWVVGNAGGERVWD